MMFVSPCCVLDKNSTSASSRRLDEFLLIGESLHHLCLGGCPDAICMRFDFLEPPGPPGESSCPSPKVAATQARIVEDAPSPEQCGGQVCAFHLRLV